MKARLPTLLALLLCGAAAFAQTNIDTLAIQDFEVAPQAPTWNFTGPVIYNSGFSSASAAPPNSPLGIGGSRAWETTVNSGGLVLDFDNVAVPGIYDSVRVRFRLAAMNLIGATGGPDNLDYVLVAYSTDGGSTYVNRLRVRGATSDNSFWAYSATGIARAYYTPATEVVFQPVTSGLQTTLGYSTCEIVFPGSVTQVRMRITGRSSSSTDTWLVDDLLITGENNCAPTSGSITATACDSYTSPSGQHVWTSSGTYADTIPNVQGCDSIIQVALTVNPTTSGNITGTYCDSLRSPSGNHLWTVSGAYFDTIPNSLGCDSIILANIVIATASSGSITATGCGSYTAPSGAVWTQSGTFMDTIPNAMGCDSVITVQLTIVNLNALVSLNGTTLTASPGGATNYQWLDCDSAFAPIPTAIFQSYTPPQSGNYAVAVTEAGCTDTSACTSVTVVGIGGALATGASLHPNPVREQAVLELGGELAATTYSVHDLRGRLLSQGPVSGAQTTLSVAALPAGHYLLRLHGESPAWLRFTKVD